MFRRLTGVVLAAAAFAAMMLAAAPSRAALVYGTAVDESDFTGSRTASGAPGGLIGENGDPVDSDHTDAVISWVIEDQGGGIFKYTYTFSGVNRPAISHITIDLSDDAVDDDEPVGPTTFFDATLTVGGVAQTPFLEFNEGPIQSEGHITGGVKFDEIAEGDDPIVIMFFSDRSPVWHNLFVKAGSVGIGNTGLFDDFLTNMNLTTIDFIPTPNSGTVVPAPAALPAGLVLMGLVALRRRNKA